jgi:fatty acid-binding protein DegV
MHQKNEVLFDFLSTFGQADGGQSQLPPAAARPVGVICDAAADVPTQFIANRDISILPTVIKTGEDTSFDRQTAQDQIKVDSLTPGDFASMEVRAMDAIALTNRYSAKFATQFDSVITVCSHHSLVDVAAQFRQFIRDGQDELRSIRKSKGLKPAMDITIHESRSIFTGTGLQAVAIRRFIKQGLEFGALRRTAERVADNTHVLFVPGDTRGFGKVLKRVGDLNVEPWIRACTGLTAFSPLLACDGGHFEPLDKTLNARKTIALALKTLTDALFKGLAIPTMLLSYGGDIAQLDQWEEFEDLKLACDEMDVQLLVFPSGLSSRALATPGSLCGAYVATGDESSFVSTLSAAD